MEKPLHRDERPRIPKIGGDDPSTARVASVSPERKN